MKITGSSSLYPTIAGIPVVIHMSGYIDGKPADEPVLVADGNGPSIHMNALAVERLGGLIVWKECA